MAEGLKIPSITQIEFTGEDFDHAERIAKGLGYEQTAYTSTSALWGLFCLPENPEHFRSLVPHHLPPFTGGCIIKTKEFGFLFVQDVEDLHMEDIPR